MSKVLTGRKRSHYCGLLNKENAGQEVVLLGWVHIRRDLGGMIFFDLRDRFGIVQVVFNDQSGPEVFARAETVRPEFVVEVLGRVEIRPEGLINKNISSGEIEVAAVDLRILNKAKTPPFYIKDGIDTDESLRLKYRYLDLRRPEMQNNLILRHKVTMAIRNFLDQEDFLEIETPMLTKSTPEGARDYLVPSRVQPGAFFALPQSPQIFKQLLMVAGFDKYFQIVRCFRDEDLRADRQPEFTQLDMEMSFVEVEDVLNFAERMMSEVFRRVLGKSAPLPFPRLTYDEAMGRFGSDKPDLRFGLELVDIADVAAGCGFKVFAGTVESGGWVRGINAKACGKYSRKEIDELAAHAAIYGAKGLAWMIVEEGGEIRSPIAKFFSPEEISIIFQKMGAEPGDLLLFIAADWLTTAESLGHLRQEIARRENLIDPDELNFLWVTDFPLLEYDPEEERWVAMHHPFTSPKDEDLLILQSQPGQVRAKAYDMVLNGMELGGGSIRIHRREVQEQLFALLGFSPEEAYSKFGFLLDAFEYGTPPHGGIAFGIDRIVMLMARRESIRDVIAFPKTKNATDLMTQAPGEVAEKQLHELCIKLDLTQDE
ncbi:MAG: aspartate--tRNA ligase [Clostridiales bacterium]|nr:aspartate--tRNA ligase [Clostridiales bacterium]